MTRLAVVPRPRRGVTVSGRPVDVTPLEFGDPRAARPRPRGRADPPQARWRARRATLRRDRAGGRLPPAGVPAVDRDV